MVEHGWAANFDVYLYSNHFEMANCWWSMAAATLRVASLCIGKANLEYVYPILPILPKFLIQLLNESWWLNGNVIFARHVFLVCHVVSIPLADAGL